MIPVVCSTCHTSLSADTTVCPHCGPDSLALILSQSDRVPTAVESDTARRLKTALGQQFEVVRLFGRGGFAEVYEVRDTELERRLAVKVLRADMAWTPGMLARFKEEARAVAQLTHPNTVPIHFVGEGEGLAFYVMPFIEGVTLADVLRAEGPLDAERAVSVALPILEALDHAHQNGIVHRDIKPDNILIESSSGRPLLVDFGIAKRVDEGTSAPETHDGIVFGTPLYMSPEQALGQHDVDARTDIYAMGALLFQMVIGAPPFDGATSQEIVAKHLTEPVRVPPACAERLPAWLVDVIVCAMAKQAPDRYQSAGAMLEPLRQGARRRRAASLVTMPRVARRVNRDDPTLQIEAVDLWALPPSRRQRRMRMALIAAGGVMLAAGGVGAALAVRGAAPAFVLENSMLAPVAVTVNGEEQRTVRPGDSLRLQLPRGAALSAQWRVVRSRSANGNEVGDELGGTISEPSPDGEVRRLLDLAAVGGGFILANVTNRTGDSLQVALRDSSGVVIPCDCPIPAGATDAPLGYFETARIRTISFATPRGATAAFAIDSLAARAAPGTGLVAVRLDSTDFVVPPVAAPRRAPARREPAVQALPELRDTLVPPALDTAAPADSAVPPARDSTVVPPRRDDPLAPIFQNGR